MPLVRHMSGRRAYFAAYGPDVEPREWSRPTPPLQRIITPTPRERKRYYAILASELWHQKQEELRLGLDANGRPLEPVKQPRQGRSDWHRRRYRYGKGPPLIPFRIDSRTRNLLRARSNEREAVVYWAARNAPGKTITWPEILIAHAIRGGERPSRDVIGLSPSGLALAVARARARYAKMGHPRPINLPRTTRWNANIIARQRPERGGNIFDISFHKVGIFERAGRLVMRLLGFQR